MHIWSLSLEEQFYFLLPVGLWVMKPSLRFPTILVAFALSLVLGAWAAGIPRYQTYAFYLLPARAWELVAGSACAWLSLRGFAGKVPRSVQWACLIIVFSCAVLKFDDAHPRVDAFLVVIATTIIIMGRATGSRERHLLRP